MAQLAEMIDTTHTHTQSQYPFRHECDGEKGVGVKTSRSVWLILTVGSDGERDGVGSLIEILRPGKAHSGLTACGVDDVRRTAGAAQLSLGGKQEKHPNG